MIKRVTKKHIKEFAYIIEKYGYWGKEVLEYNSKFEYSAMQRLQNKVRIFNSNWKKIIVDK